MPENYVFGRPTLYKPEYCQTVIDDAMRGHSLVATAALIGVDRSTLFEWAGSHPDFYTAVSRAKAIRARTYERDLIDMKESGGDNTRFQAVKLGLINLAPEDWKEKTSSETTVHITLATLIQESMKTIASSPPLLEQDKPSD